MRARQERAGRAGAVRARWHGRSAWGAVRAGGARGRQAGACTPGARRGLGSRVGCRRVACAHLGMLAELWAVPLVHLACF